MLVDYIIIGQGICGTLLSYQLQQKNKTFIVIDESLNNTASKVASGVINPITGRRFVKTWMIDELLPIVKETYQSIEHSLNISIFKETAVIDFHTTLQMKKAFEERAKSETIFLNNYLKEDEFKNYFLIEHGLGKIEPCYLVDMNTLLENWRTRLKETNSLLEEVFNEDELVFEENTVRYKNIEAKKIIYCNGINASKSKWFKHLPFAPNKGEALIVEIPSLSNKYLYKNGITIVPWEENLFWVGSSYEWNVENDEPTLAFKERLITSLNQWLKMPYKIVEHLSSIRPTNTERRPFVGTLKHQPQIAMLNGMGTKGCSLAPYFVNELVNNLITNSPINNEADINRFQQ
jgi:glycine/D-amino acid oxidase-like deaminating enzyme